MGLGRSWPVWLLFAGLLLGCQPGAESARAGSPVEFEHFVNWQLLGDRQIIFRSSADGDWDIYIADGFGDELRRVTADRHHNRYADPSPDGSRVLYSSSADGGDFDLFIVGIDGSDLIQLTANDLEDYSPVFSPDGRRIVFERDVDFFQLFELDLDSGRVRQLTDVPWHNYAPDWSPDGHELAYFANPEGDFDIYVIRTEQAAGQNPERVVDTFAFAQFPDFDPSGKRIAFEAFESGDWDLFAFDRESGGIRRVTRGGGDDRDPDYSPDGQQIAFSRAGEDSADIWITGADGVRADLLISTPGRDSQPVWIKSPRGH